MKKLFNKLFIAGKWQVYLDDNGNKQIIKPSKGYWYADPFLFVAKEKYLFVEAFKKSKELGQVGYLSSADGYKKLSILIEGNRHYSFPNVFKINGQIYMLPESSESHGVYLYRFDAFPNKLTLVKELVHGDFVDTALVTVNGYKAILLSYTSDSHKLYQIDVDFKSLESTYKLLLDDKEKQLRPAGNAYTSNGKIYIPLQNCKDKYGESVIIRELRINNGTVELLNPFKIIDSSSIKELKMNRIHTFNTDGNNAFVYDFMKEGFSLFKSFRMLRRKLRRKRHKDK